MNATICSSMCVMLQARADYMHEAKNDDAAEVNEINVGTASSQQSQLQP